MLYKIKKMIRRWTFKASKYTVMTIKITLKKHHDPTWALSEAGLLTADHLANWFAGKLGDQYGFGVVQNKHYVQVSGAVTMFTKDLAKTLVSINKINFEDILHVPSMSAVLQINWTTNQIKESI